METPDSLSGPKRLDSKETLELIRRKAERLFRSGAIRGHDEDDLAQELAIRVLPRIGQYQPIRGEFEAFLATLLEHEAVSLIRYFNTKKRSTGCQISLHIVPTHAKGTELCEILSPNLDKRRAPPARSPEDNSDVRQDVRDIIGGMSKRDRRLCRLAMKYGASEISLRTGIPRTTVQSRLKSLRSRFRNFKDF